MFRTNSDGIRYWVEVGRCQLCGDPFEKYGDRRYCSRQCKGIAAGGRRRARRIAGAACLVCNGPAAMVKHGRGGGPRCAAHANLPRLVPLPGA